MNLNHGLIDGDYCGVVLFSLQDIAKSTQRFMLKLINKIEHLRFGMAYNLTNRGRMHVMYLCM